jgi:hypothetical protein
MNIWTLSNISTKSNNNTEESIKTEDNMDLIPLNVTPSIEKIYFKIKHRQAYKIPHN